MAFVSSGSPDQDPNQQPGQNPLSQQAPVTSAPNAGGTGKATTGQPSNSVAAQPFTNLSSYLTANAPQISNEANTIAGNLTSGYNATTGAIDQASQNFGKDVAAGYTPNDPNVLSSFQANPTAVAADPNQSKAFTGMYNDQYTGPSTFQDSSYYAPLSSQVQQGQATAAQVGTVPGLQSYLSQGNPNYSLGQSTLDSVLLNGDQNAVSTIQNAATPYSTLPGYLTSAVTAGNAAAQKAQQDAQATKAAAQSAAQTAGKNLTGTVNSELASADKTAQDYNKSVSDYITRTAAVPQQERALNDLMAQYGAKWNAGITPPAPSNPSSYPVNQVIGLPTMNQAATSQDFATEAALEALTGGQVTSPLAGLQPGVATPIPTLDVGNSGSDYTNFLKFISANANNISTSQQNLSPFVDAANSWYLNLLKAGGTPYSGTPQPFTVGTTGGTPGRQPGLV